MAWRSATPASTSKRPSRDQDHEVIKTMSPSLPCHFRYTKIPGVTEVGIVSKNSPIWMYVCLITKFIRTKLFHFHDFSTQEFSHFLSSNSNWSCQLKQNRFIFTIFSTQQDNFKRKLVITLRFDSKNQKLVKTQQFCTF